MDSKHTPGDQRMQAAKEALQVSSDLVLNAWRQVAGQAHPEGGLAPALQSGHLSPSPQAPAKLFERLRAALLASRESWRGRKL